MSPVLFLLRKRTTMEQSLAPPSTRAISSEQYRDGRLEGV